MFAWKDENKRKRGWGDPFLKKYLKSAVVYLSGVSPEWWLGREPFTADVAVEWPVLEPLQLRFVIAKMLLQVRQLQQAK